MKVRVILKGVTGLERSLEIPVEFPESTLGELSLSLAGKLDSKAKALYLGEEGGIKLDVLVVV